MAPRRRNAAGTGDSGRLRIIGGRWRSRRIEFAAVAGVRPTADRIRETLFNWLRDVIPGARCLDLYAGSGALGFEALSRGAGSVVLVDQDIRVVQQLQASAEQLGARDAQVVWSEALEFLAQDSKPAFDVVFLDHTGFEGAESFSRFLRGELIGRMGGATRAAICHDPTGAIFAILWPK